MKRTSGGSVLAALFVFFAWKAFAFMGSPSSSLTFAHAFPVPFVPSRGDKNIIFADLSSIATIRIYSLNGDLVQTLQESDGDGLYVWDVKSSDGNDLSGGVYLFEIQSPSDERTGKLVVVR